MSLRLLIAACLASAGVVAQSQTSTQDLWILDQASANIVVLNSAVDPTVLQTVVLGGIGQVRSLSFDPAGLAFVCRGDEVRTYDGSMSPSVLFAGTGAGVSQPQDVAVRPDAGGDVYVACGTSPASSKILRFSSAGIVLATLTTGLLDHPRRLAWNADGTKLYVGSVGNQRILEYDPVANAFAQVIDLAPSNLTPIGLSFDAVRTGLWVTGDWGGAGGGVSFVQLTPAPPMLFPVISLTAAGGLAAPAGVFFDRFRNLFVAGRNQNGGAGGAYVFDASSGNTATLLRTATGLGILSVIDARPRPEIVGFDAPRDPMDMTKLVMNASGSVAVANPLKFRVPRVPGGTYFAAMSLQWPVECAPYIPGLIDPVLTIVGPDPRGVPLKYDVFFRQTAAVCCAGQSPPLSMAGDPPLPPFLQVLGFAGVLDAAGEATGSLNFAAGIPMSADGAVFSIAFVVIDPMSSSLFGQISDSFCVTAKVVP
jgi:DNA-binding beta-propeller fold protein YncE